MNLKIDPSLATPIYAQIVEQVTTLVASRALRPGDQLPSVRELASRLRLNRNTAAKAYQQLESERVIETHQGQGCFVASTGPRWSREERIRRLERAIDRVLVEADHLEVPHEEIHSLLRKRISMLTRRQARRLAGT